MKKIILISILPLMRAVTINFVETPISRFLMDICFNVLHGFLGSFKAPTDPIWISSGTKTSWDRCQYLRGNIWMHLIHEDPKENWKPLKNGWNIRNAQFWALMKPHRPQRDFQWAKNVNICQYLKVTAEKRVNALDTQIPKLGPNTASYLEK